MGCGTLASRLLGAQISSAWNCPCRPSPLPLGPLRPPAPHTPGPSLPRGHRPGGEGGAARGREGRGRRGLCQREDHRELSGGEQGRQPGGAWGAPPRRLGAGAGGGAAQPSLIPRRAEGELRARGWASPRVPSWRQGGQSSAQASSRLLQGRHAAYCGFVVTSLARGGLPGAGGMFWPRLRSEVPQCEAPVPAGEGRAWALGAGRCRGGEGSGRRAGGCRRQHGRPPHRPVACARSASSWRTWGP